MEIIRFFNGFVRQHIRRTIAMLNSVNLPITIRYISDTQKVIQNEQSNGLIRKLLGDIFKYFPIATLIEWTNPLISITITQIASIAIKFAIKLKSLIIIFLHFFPYLVQYPCYLRLD